jgi:hypothetical protein
MAYVAYQKAGREEKAEQLRRELLGGEEPFDAPGAKPEDPDSSEDANADELSSPA